VRLVLPDLTLDLQTDRGVFAADAVDAGTKLLLSEAAAGVRVPQGSVDVCDLGCGYGPIAVTLALRSPSATVWAVDVNARARALTAANAAAHGVGDRVRVCAPDEVPDGVRFAALWSNPPIRVGKDALHALLATWLDRLVPGDGEAWLVVHKHLGADTLAAWLSASGWPTVRERSRLGYRLLRVGARG
jgi:16S rRNA (guanine1207-N2)-methyltransferase